MSPAITQVRDASSDNGGCREEIYLEVRVAPRSWATGRMELLFIEGEDSGGWEDMCLEGEGQTRGVWF